jgi:hypothetical protein
MPFISFGCAVVPGADRGGAGERNMSYLSLNLALSLLLVGLLISSLHGRRRVRVASAE